MYIIIYDFGTSSVKTCLFQIDSQINLVAGATAGYGLYISDDGGAEQDTEEWWQAICQSTEALFHQTDVSPDQVSGLAFCAQMQTHADMNVKDKLNRFIFYFRYSLMNASRGRRYFCSHCGRKAPDGQAWVR